MLPMISVRQALGTLLAADTANLAAATANEVALISANFTATENLTTAELTLASGDGADPIVGVSGVQLVGNDPLTLEQVITIKEPAGGWRWELTGVPSPAITIYGLALTLTAGGALLGVMKLPTPITLTNIGDFYDAGNIQMRFVAQPIS